MKLCTSVLAAPYRAEGEVGDYSLVLHVPVVSTLLPLADNVTV